MRQRHFIAMSFIFAATVQAAHATAQTYAGTPPQLPPSAPQQTPPTYNPPSASPYGQAPPPQEAPPGWAPPGYAGAPAAPYRYPATPMEMRYVEGRAIPQGYHLESRPRKGLVVSGSIVFGIAYFLSLSVAASSKYEPDRWLYAPLIGPFVDLGNRKENCSTIPMGSFGTSTTCQDDSSERFFLMADGLMQASGSLMLILGLALPQQLLVRDDAPYVSGSPSRFAWTITPRGMGRSGYGLGVVGTF